MMLFEPPPFHGIGKEELAPPISPQPRLAMLDTATVLRLTSQDSLADVKVSLSLILKLRCITCTFLLWQELLLHNHRLTRFRLSSSLPHLHKLVLSFNELTTAEDFNNMVYTCSPNNVTIYYYNALFVPQPNLQVLDLSFNKLTSLQGLKVSLIFSITGFS